MPRRRDGPGPGAYDIPSSICGLGTKGVSLKNGSRAGGQQVQPMPGPADYVPIADCPSLKNSARTRFSKSERFGRTGEDTPGPCQYTPRNPCHSSQRKTIGAKDDLKLPGVSNVSPGPGAYTPRTVSESLKMGTSFCKGSSRWASLSQDASPGPAAYILDKEPKRVAASNGFGCGPRLKGDSVNDKTPGPGTYACELKPHGPKISMTPRRDEFY
eukprot:gb/GFBE01041092.1/.p1 GENE.gb/GFBE01041092.1/~~gb/GFBE01041092.1/.p1  ORF type:complete len:214 (+),score=7.55 gb/GFBE01041092.1/:1-642(+)